MAVQKSILAAIGSTPIVELRKLVKPGMARVLVKIEGANPTGSKKDRMAREVIQAAERDGRLKSGQAVVEYTGGSTGTSLALVCAATGHPLFIVTSDAFSQEKRDHMAALGAELEVIPSENGQITADLIKSMIARASEISQQKGAFWTDQLNNDDATRGYYGLGEEIWEQAGGHVDAYVESVGTSHSILGVSHILQERNPEIEIIVVEPAESAVLSGEKTGAHRIEGIGLGFVPPAWKRSIGFQPMGTEGILPSFISAVDSVSTDDAYAMARLLAKEEAIFAGGSSGANVVAALRIAERLGEGKTVVTLAVDSGMKYLSTEIYRTRR